MYFCIMNELNLYIGFGGAFFFFSSSGGDSGGESSGSSGGLIVSFSGDEGKVSAHLDFNLLGDPISISEPLQYFSIKDTSYSKV